MQIFFTENPDLKWFGAKGNNVDFDNEALEKYVATFGNDCTVYASKPAVKYLFSTPILLGKNVKLNFEKGTEVEYTITKFLDQNTEILNDTKMYFRDIYMTQVYPEKQLKQYYISENDYDKATYSKMATNEFNAYQTYWGNADSGISSLPASVVDSSTISVPVGVDTSCIMCDISNDESLIANFSNKSFTEDFKAGAVIFDSIGRMYFLMADNYAYKICTNKNGIWSEKLTIAISNYDSYRAQNSIWEIKKVNDKFFQNYIKWS